MNIPLDRQISAAKRELAMRRATFPRMIAASRMTELRAADEIAAMEAILSTLDWLQRNEDEVRGYVAERMALRGDPAVQNVMREFPDAKVSVNSKSETGDA